MYIKISISKKNEAKLKYFAKKKGISVSKALSLLINSHEDIPEDIDADKDVVIEGQTNLSDF